jgi:predicted HTH transcriptional regulator
MIAIRELVANALIHQDMTVTGAGPIIEIYDDRVEITNPGTPVTDMLNKLFGAPPRSRNEMLATLMRRMAICEEQGSGLVKVITAVEEFRLPAAEFRAIDGSMRVVLSGPRAFSDLDKAERVRLCYQHAALMHHNRKLMTNADLRERFEIKDQNAAQVSRVIKEALAQGLIRIADPERPKAGYVPYWA